MARSTSKCKATLRAASAAAGDQPIECAQSPQPAPRWPEGRARWPARAQRPRPGRGRRPVARHWPLLLRACCVRAACLKGGVRCAEMRGAPCAGMRLDGRCTCRGVCLCFLAACASVCMLTLLRLLIVALWHWAAREQLEPGAGQMPVRHGRQGARQGRGEPVHPEGAAARF